MQSAKVMRRWTVVPAYVSVALIVIGVFAFAIERPYLGVGLMMTAPVLMIVGILSGLYSLIRTACHQCGKRFFSFSFPVWPFENCCANCGAHISEA